tara:strand:- start:15051 stop:15593 length:543 start_codon:yes stop_codon:yes gene_type:complete
MKKLICKRALRTHHIGIEKWGTFTEKGYNVFEGEKFICFISKCEDLQEWKGSVSVDSEFCAYGDTKKEILNNIEWRIQTGIWGLNYKEIEEKRRAERMRASAILYAKEHAEEQEKKRVLKEEEEKNPFEGIELLRGLVNSFGWRNEQLNANKTPEQLIKEFKDYSEGVTDLDGNVYEDED